jgi:alkylation response protein AidB-like acyl-CoA dehydrogenase
MTSSSRLVPAQDAMVSTRGLNFYVEDPNLAFVCSAVMSAETFGRAERHLVDMGAVAGGELDALAAEADRNPPVLRAWDQRGRRIDEIVFHPAYVEMEKLAYSRFGLAAMSHREGVLGWAGIVPHVVKYALSYLFAQSEFGLLCPVSLTDSTARMLRWYARDELKAAYLPRLTTTEFGELWQGTQWMTERTGGSDVGAITTTARQEVDGTWRLTGEKWFCSNANADVVLTLARPEGAADGTQGLTMFVVPRVLPDGSRNAWTINRLKDKLGSRSMATGEVTFAGAVGYVIGDPARGFRQMVEMVNVSRLSNAMRAAGIMRRCVLEAVTHARARMAFGRPLAELPQLRRDLLEMLLDAEAAASVVLNTAAVLDEWDAGSAEARPIFRIITPLAKYWITARARGVAAEAMNVRGGNGYIEEWVNARLLRDSYLGGIWEGATNVVALDVQRAILRERAHEALIAFVEARLGTVSEAAVKPGIDAVRAALDEARRRTEAWSSLEPTERELEARPVADLLYHALAASLLFGEGQRLRDDRDDFRKFVAAGLYVRRYLRPGAWAVTSRDLALLDPLLDWIPLGRDAVG